MGALKQLKMDKFDITRAGDMKYIFEYAVSQNPAGVGEALTRNYGVNPNMVRNASDTVHVLMNRYKNGLPTILAFRDVKIDPTNGADKEAIAALAKDGSAVAGLAGGSNSPKPFGSTFVGGLLTTLVPGLATILLGNNPDPAAAPPAPEEETKEWYQETTGIIAIIAIVLVLIAIAAILFRQGKGGS